MIGRSLEEYDAWLARVTERDAPADDEPDEWWDDDEDVGAEDGE